MKILFLHLVLWFLVEKKSLPDLCFCFEYELCRDVRLRVSYKNPQGNRRNPRFSVVKYVKNLSKSSVGIPSSSPLVAMQGGRLLPLLWLSCFDMVTEVNALSCRRRDTMDCPHGGWWARLDWHGYIVRGAKMWTLTMYMGWKVFEESLSLHIQKFSHWRT